MSRTSRKTHARLMCGAASAALLLWAGNASAQTAAKVEIAPQPLASALNEFGVQTGRQVIFAPSLTGAKRTPGVSADGDIELALARLLEGSGLTFRRDEDTFLIVQGGSNAPQSGSAAGAGAEVEALIVTAQKREEDIQDVPIAMSAFSQETLERTQIAGGPDLMTQVPNMTFTKTNFSSYSISIRGIGTQAISATTDPAVAVAFNNASMIQNRFFEQEFYDLQRVEVLRGPQGTLYGRNATAGVVNILTARPKDYFEARASADIANYGSTRIEAMVNLPLVEDRLALRLAGAWTKRQGYVTNQVTGSPIDGRDLWSTRLTLGFEPTDRINAYFTWEHFEEDDDRLRSGKQLCKKDAFPSHIGGVAVPVPNQGGSGSSGTSALNVLTYLSQGCEAASLYSPESFQTPNGYALPFYGPLITIGLPARPGFDVYQNATQSRDLRVIESSFDPNYRAKNDTAHLQVNIDLTDQLSLVSETVYATDELFSFQDYNRFTTAPGAFVTNAALIEDNVLDENGVFCDPQLGCSDRLTLGDLSTHWSSQFSQELRLGSDFDGPFNFSLGTGFTRYDTVNKYYVFVNSLTLFSSLQFGSSRPPGNPYIPGISDNSECLSHTMYGNPFGVYNIVPCVPIDPNPVDSLDDSGHNYFLSKNPYRLTSYAVFGEAYYNVTPDLKLTAGLRWTVDKKHAPRVPSQLLASNSIGYPTAEIVEQEWREPTGRLTVDWKPDLAFTDETLLYASYAHGYKAGGANPPSIAFTTFNGTTGQSSISHTEFAERYTGFPKIFEPEFVDAYELGTKNTLLDGRLTFNANLFYYDYKGYQISQIIDRTALNMNFDAEVWGGEVEADWRPLDNLRLGLKLGFNGSRVGDGQSAIDLIDRTAGNPDYIVFRPFPAIPSNCIIPVKWIQDWGVLDNSGAFGLGTCSQFASGSPNIGANSPWTAEDIAAVPNNGAGIEKDLSGNQLPNAPEMTATLTVDYTLPLQGDWLVTFHADLYRQSEAWTRIYNSDPYDRLEPFKQVNLAAIFVNEDAGWTVMTYVKNALDSDNITGAFLNSDDTGLTTNVFLNEPRLYGLRVTKTWSGEPWWTPGTGAGGLFPLTVELGGSVQRMDAPGDTFRPAWVDEFTSPTLPFPIGTQDEDLDWADGREAKLTWRPLGQWSVSAGARFGRTNGTATHFLQETVPAGYTYATPAGGSFGTFPPKRGFDSRNAAQSSTEGHEEHTLIDFAVGRDAGLGVLGERMSSTVSLGVRYGEFKSSTATLMEGIPDYYIPAYRAKYIPATLSHHKADFARRSEFEGAGPVLSWDASKTLFETAAMGHVDLDWSLSGGALFGDRDVSVEGGMFSEAFSLTFFQQGFDRFRIGNNPINPVTTPLTPRTESTSVTVPFAGVSAGLSYTLDRFRFGAGYRWERYYDILDGGIEEAKDVDRTIDGPYFKLSVGFGGG